ncbi:MAG: hypothetical protein ACLFQV_12030 [Vulcanimicrobiota bacterium]
MVQAQDQYSNPHGSPFAPGKEPSLTHTVKVFYSTIDGIDKTVITVKSPGNHPAQVESLVTRGRGEKKAEQAITAIINPECNYKFVIVNKDNKEKNNGKVYETNSAGTVTVRIFGFKADDFEQCPMVEASYYNNYKLLGTTLLKTHPLPEKFMKK